MSVLKTLLGIVVLIVIVLVNTIVVMWCERKWLGHMQSRQGPRRTGWHGWMQPFADAIKLLGKEDLRPAAADKWPFLIAPIIAFTPSVLVYAAMPWVEEFTGFSFDVGIFLIFAIVAVFPVGMLLAGWSSHNKYSLLGGFPRRRPAGELRGADDPGGHGDHHACRVAQALRHRRVAEPGVERVPQPFAFILFIIGMLAELNRTPFDMPEAESELVGGFNTEYSSMRFALFFVAEYMNVFTWSLITVLLFFGGWGGPLLPDFVRPFAKTYLMVFCIIWVRATFPRVRVDQLMAISWKLLLPAALINVLLTAVGVMTSTWVLVTLELVAAGIFVWLVGWLGEHAGDKLRAAAAERIAGRTPPEPGSPCVPGEAAGDAEGAVA